jgi:hypothetical protein
VDQNPFLLNHRRRPNSQWIRHLFRFVIFVTLPRQSSRRAWNSEDKSLCLNSRHNTAHTVRIMTILAPFRVLMVLVLSTGAAFGQAAAIDWKRELAQLQDQREKALAAADEPVNRRYLAALEQLQRRVTQTGDLDGALKIRTEIEALSKAMASPAGAAPATTPASAASPTAPTGTPAPGALRILAGMHWAWFEDLEFVKGGNWLEFNKDGSGKSSFGHPIIWSVDGTTLSVQTADADRWLWVFALDLEKKQAVGIPEKSHNNEPRSLRFERRSR